jgi:hypothetical protein
MFSTHQDDLNSAIGWDQKQTADSEDGLKALQRSTAVNCSHHLQRHLGSNGL